jgi:hypothetical protein
MSKSEIKAIKTIEENKQPAAGASAYDSTVEVLYQKMGDRWFAFSLVDDEVFVGSISQEEIDARAAAEARQAKIRSA